MASPHATRILFATPTWPPEFSANGITSYVARVRSGLEALGHHSSVVSGQIGPSRARDVFDLSAEPLPTPVRLGLRAMNRLDQNAAIGFELGLRFAREVRRHPAIDVFEIEESFGSGAVLRPFYDGCLVVRLHGPWEVVGVACGTPDDRAFRVRVAAEWRAMRVADLVTAPSRLVLEGVEKRHGEGLDHALVIPNPAESVPESERWSPATRVRHRVLFVGRFDRVKGADILFAAFERVVQRHPDAELVFVGPGDTLELDGTKYSPKEYLESRVSPAARARIRMRGALPPADIAALRKTAHVTVIASRFENFPMTGLEALAVGCPLVASDAGGIPEIVRDGFNGLVYRNEDAAELAARIERLLVDDDLATTLSAHAVRDCADRFSIAHVTRKTLDAYEAARERRRRARR